MKKITAPKQIVTILFIMIIFAIGMISTSLLWNSNASTMAEDALEQARIVARSIDSRRLATLNGEELDLGSPDYLRIKEQLTRIRLSHRTCRFLYLMGRRHDGTVFFHLDSQPEYSEDYAPPGLIYDEVSPEYLAVFDTGVESTVGPIKDRWGTLITSLVPIYGHDNERMIAVLGMDIDAKDWNRKLISQCIRPIAMTLLIILLAIMLLILDMSRQKLRTQYDEKYQIAADLQKALHHVSKLEGLLPMCAWCNRIRDAQGHWDDLETYIEKYSEAHFSHGICEECADKHYGDRSWYKKS